MVAIQVRASQIREEARVWGPRVPIGSGQTNFAEALARLFEDAAIDDQGNGNALTGRLQNVLAASADSFSPNMSHFSGIFKDWTDGVGDARCGDNGFKPYFQDYSLWPGSSMQVSHFLTAVDMGFQPRKLFNFAEPVKNLLEALADADREPGDFWTPRVRYFHINSGAWPEDEETCVEYIIAHEQVPDAGTYGQEPTFWNKVQTVVNGVRPDDLRNFRKAFNALGTGQNDPDQIQALLAPIPVKNGSGNSMQDLLLSTFGFKFGAMIRKGELTQLSEGGKWLRLNLKDPRTP